MTNKYPGGNDAYWQVPGGIYVPVGPVPEVPDDWTQALTLANTMQGRLGAMSPDERAHFDAQVLAAAEGIGALCAAKQAERLAAQ